MRAYVVGTRTLAVVDINARLWVFLRGPQKELAWTPMNMLGTSQSASQGGLPDERTS